MAKSSRSAARGAASTSFEAATPRSIRAANRDPGSLAQIAAIETRTARVKERAREHFGKFVETWVVKEAMDLWKKRAGLSKDPAPQSLLAKEFVSTGLMADARRNVHARMTQRLTKINGIRTRMSNAVVRNLQVMQPGQTRAQGITQTSPTRKGPRQ